MMNNNICRFYRDGYCRKNNCNYSHPPDFCYYFYTGKTDIHPDELRIIFMSSKDMVVAADDIFIQNYIDYHKKYSRTLKGYKIDFNDICRPFEPERVYSEINSRINNPASKSQEDNYSRRVNSNNFSQFHRNTIQNERSQVDINNDKSDPYDSSEYSEFKVPYI